MKCETVREIVFEMGREKDFDQRNGTIIGRWQKKNSAGEDGKRRNSTEK